MNVEMAQRSILSMFRKSNDRLGNPDHEKTRLEDPVTTDLIVCSRPGKPTEHYDIVAMCVAKGREVTLSHLTYAIISGRNTLDANDNII